MLTSRGKRALFLVTRMRYEEGRDVSFRSVEFPRE